jgi:Sulfotransferase domain
MTLRLCVWSGPRNVSTALMYSFAQRADTRVVDEPLYAYYLDRSGAEHPGREQVLAAQDRDGERVVRDVVLGDCDRSVLFLKQMAHHLAGLGRGFLDQVTSVLLVRDPLEMLPSLAQFVGRPTLADTGLGDQVELLEERRAAGEEPPVLDARELLLDPPGVLRGLCERIGIAFEPGMLAWGAGARPEDGVWAPHWYASVHVSTGFRPYRSKTEALAPELEPVLAECRPYYDRLLEVAIKAEAERGS